MSRDVTDFLLRQAREPSGDDGLPGLLVDGSFWYWQPNIDAQSIYYTKAKASAFMAERWAGVTFAILFLGLFTAGVVLEHQEAILDPAFWDTPSWTVAALCLSILSGLFVFYRTVAERREPVSLKRLDLATVPEVVTIPSLEAVERRRDIATVMSADGRSALEEAYRVAATSQHAEVQAFHIFVGSLSTKPVQVLFARLGLSLDVLKDTLRRRLATFPAGTPHFGLAAQRVTATAMLHALQTRRGTISVLELFSATVELDSFIGEMFDAKGISDEELQNAIAWMRIQADLRDRYEAFRTSAAYKPTGNMNRSMTAVATPFLDSVSEDLTRAAVQGQTGLLVGRDAEMEMLLRAIEGGDQSVVLVGQPGVGKEALIDGLADLMVEERVPAVLQDKRLLRLSIPHIVSAQGGNGADERFLYALNQVGRTGNVILVIENIHELVGQGEGFDLSSILAGELSRGYTFVIATTTPQAYTEIVERSVLSPKLHKIDILEPERNDAIRVLEAKVGGVESKHGVVFTYGALAAAVDLSSRYLHDGALPEKAIEIMKEAALTVSKRGQRPAWVKKEDVATLIAERTRIPVTEVSQREGEKLLHLEERVHARVIGQHAAVTAVAAALRRARTELRSGQRPIANFLFLGPTGVGKTELAKATAEVYFGNEQAMARFDMSEYQDASSVTRLIGGNGQVGLLTEAVRKNPFCLLLLDELEKAHPDILNLFLQVMDDGRLTDGLGRTVDFTNVILIATSNAGTTYIQDQVAVGADLATIKTALLESELRQIYRPEFLNRFDDVIVFSPLTQDDVVAIAYLLIDKVIERLKAKGVNLKITDGAIHELAEQGYDPKFGARPLRRVVQDKLENPLAEYLLRGQVGRRDTLVFDVGGQLELQKAPEL